MVDTAAKTLQGLADDLEPHEWLAASRTHAVLVASSGTMAASVIRIDLESGRRETLRVSWDAPFSASFIAQPHTVEFPAAGGQSAHAFYYRPTNSDVRAPGDERPPLIAISHGGPTTASTSVLDLRVQFWTSRGFAVVDVNYGGSSGYGRPYRERLRGAWGIVDVEDMINAVRHLVAEGLADPERLIVRGGSAGGYTTLAALTSYPEVFRAGASLYGVSDIEILARETHKFESRYLDTLVGPYPAMRHEYRRRSPIDHVDRLSCPLIFFQGLEDRVVPPNQSATMADAVRRKGLPVAYLTFEGEQHGFRKAETIVRCLEAELFFYGVVFGFEPADRIEPLRIENHP
jgi:dipeptidyl aminopeptidase/acylaminoacyl peptidase